MNKVYNCKNNLPVYIGNYPGGKVIAPGLKPRKSQFYYEVTNDRNLDKILSSEAVPQILDSNLKAQKKESEKLSQNNLQPTVDLEQSGESKRKFEALFKV